MFKKVIGIGLLLALFTGLSGFAVASTNSLTEDIIAEQKITAQRNSLLEVYPGAGEIKDESAKYLAEAIAGLSQINVVYDAGVPVGVIYTVAAQGYNGLVRTLVAFDTNTKMVTGVKVLEQKETPGLGNNSTKAWFVERFQTKGVAKELEVTKLKPKQDNEIQAITSATITTTAVVDGVNVARQHFLQNFVTTP